MRIVKKAGGGFGIVRVGIRLGWVLLQVIVFVDVYGRFRLFIDTANLKPPHNFGMDKKGDMDSRAGRIVVAGYLRVLYLEGRKPGLKRQRVQNNSRDFQL